MGAHTLRRDLHTKRSSASGHYAKTPPCDGCGKPVGTAYFTDDEVCGTSDGPGFYVCERKRCVAALAGLSVDQRRAHYEAQRAASAKPAPASYDFITTRSEAGELAAAGYGTVVEAGTHEGVRPALRCTGKTAEYLRQYASGDGGQYTSKAHFTALAYLQTFVPRP